MNLGRVIWPSIAIVAVALLVSDKLQKQQIASTAASVRDNNEFYAWERTPLGTYNNVTTVLNAMSTNQPRSNWILSHTTASTFECLPAKIKPRNASEEPSSESDDPAVHLGGSGLQSRAGNGAPRLAEGATLATLNQQSMCSDQAKKAFADLRYPKDAMAGYESHFNVRLNKCFIAVTNTDTRVDPGRIWTYRFVFDAAKEP